MQRRSERKGSTCNVSTVMLYLYVMRTPLFRNTMAHDVVPDANAARKLHPPHTGTATTSCLPDREALQHPCQLSPKTSSSNGCLKAGGRHALTGCCLHWNARSGRPVVASADACRALAFQREGNESFPRNCSPFPMIPLHCSAQQLNTGAKSAKGGGQGKGERRTRPKRKEASWRPPPLRGPGPREPCLWKLGPRSQCCATRLPPAAGSPRRFERKAWRTLHRQCRDGSLPGLPTYR